MMVVVLIARYPFPPPHALRMMCSYSPDMGPALVNNVSCIGFEGRLDVCQYSLPSPLLPCSTAVILNCSKCCLCGGFRVNSKTTGLVSEGELLPMCVWGGGDSGERKLYNTNSLLRCSRGTGSLGLKASGRVILFFFFFGRKLVQWRAC